MEKLSYEKNRLFHHSLQTVGNETKSIARVAQSMTLKCREIQFTNRISDSAISRESYTHLSVAFLPCFFLTLLNISLLEILEAIEANMESFLAAVFKGGHSEITPSGFMSRSKETENTDVSIKMF